MKLWVRLKLWVCWLLGREPAFAPPEQATYDNLEALLAAVREFVRKHEGSQVLAADNPSTLMLGWVAFQGDTSEYFTIKLTKLKASINALSPDDPLIKELSTAEGRRVIAAQLARGINPLAPKPEQKTH